MRWPLVAEMPLPAPPQCFEAFSSRPLCFFLDSAMDPARLGRYSFLGCDPFLVLQSRGRNIRLLQEGKEHQLTGNPFDVLGELLREYALDREDCPVPLAGGVVGYFGYDLCHFLERLPATAVDDLQLPECYLAFYDTVVACDHQERKAFIVSTGFPHRAATGRQRRARERLREVEALLHTPSHEPVLRQAQDGGFPSAATDPLKLRSNFTREEYVAAVEAAREYICAGDIFQVNLSQRFQAPLPVPPHELYRRLRHINPAPFAAYLDCGEVSIVSASPERFLRVRGDVVETRPIKGTRPRGRTPEQDRALAQQLLASEKDRAENVMIVDLERNDLGRVCRYGSVKVTELCLLETYPTVFHLTSTVVGRLREGVDRVDLLKATFPGGSVTGAPKVRSMEIIDELEPTRRNVYTGSIGYLSFDGSMDLNIVIRTFLVKEGRAYFQVGGGIVYDSDPEGEYVETLDKARALVEALGLAPDSCGHPAARGVSA